VRGPAFLLAVALAVLPAVASWQETVALSRPSEAVCLTGPSAEYTVESGALRPERGSFAISPPGRDPLEPRLSLPAETEPGAIARVYVRSSERLTSVTAALGTPGAATLTSVAGFRLSASELPEVWAVLVGVPDSSAPRDYRLTLSASAGERRFLNLSTITVKAREFSTERIPVTSALSALLSTPDPKKTAQSRAFYRLITTPDPTAIFDPGPFTVPLPEARRSAGFGDRRRYVADDGESPASVHAGVDLAMPEGTPIPSCGDGRVVFAEYRILTGNTVVIEHLPGLFSIYFHMSAISTKKGAIVKRGELIGALGMTGFATGPHLHWEVTSGGIAVDPDLLVGSPLLDKTPDFVETFPRNSTEGR
jgi:murein DD-endopeptidase MepM/ murein hydrolase activator NlpD